MKIPSNLAQFTDKNFFIIVAGRQDAVLYKTDSSTLQKLDEFKIPRPRYSDNEGAAKKPSSGVRMRSGTMPEISDGDLVREFLQELSKRVKKAKGFEKIYILASQQIKNKIKSALPKVWQKKSGKVIVGNFFHHHPLEILKKIAKEEKSGKKLIRK